MSTPITTEHGTELWIDEYDSKHIITGRGTDGLIAEIGEVYLHPEGGVFALRLRGGPRQAFSAPALRALADLIDQTTNEQETPRE